MKYHNLKHSSEQKIKSLSEQVELLKLNIKEKENEMEMQQREHQDISSKLPIFKFRYSF